MDALFQPFPSEITFRGYKPYESYQVTLKLRNNDKVARTISIEPLQTTIFKLTSSNQNGAKKIAPGMEATYTVTFVPDSTEDYHCDLVCVTERERFIVPINTIGARGELDIPEHIKFSKCPVKYNTTKTILCSNIGTKTANIVLSTDFPFDVTPKSCSIRENERFQVNISCIPQRNGHNEGYLKITYDTGEEKQIRLTAIAEDVNVALEKDAVEAESMFTSLSSQTKFKIINKSDVKVHYSWRNFTKVQEESVVSDETASAAQNLNSISDNNNTDSKRERERIFKLNLEKKLLFQNEFFDIYPLEGDVWPNSSTEFTVTFSPQFEQLYTATAYCEIQGREARLPLYIKGQGMGPRAAFSIQTLDLGLVYVNTVHNYDVKIKNIGQIPCDFELGKCSSPVGSKFKFIPSSGHLEVGQEQDIQIVFTPDFLGDYTGHFEWDLKTAAQPLMFGFKVQMLGPTFSFDEKSLDFGVVSYGFANKKLLHLRNTSEIPMQYKLRITSPEVDNIAKEFILDPASGSIPPFRSQEIKVQFTSFNVQKYSQSNLMLDVDCVGEGVLSVPITADCVVPQISLSNSAIDFGKCYLNASNSMTIKFHNDTDLSAGYELIPQDESSQTSGAYTVDEPDGNVEGYSNKTVKVIFIAKKIGNINLPLYFRIKGSNQPPLEVALSGVGCGPDVSIDFKKDTIIYGRIPVLTKVEKKLRLSNDSNIPAICRASTKSKNFTVSPEQFTIAPNQHANVVVTAFLDDTLPFASKLSIEVQDGSTFSFQIKAEAEGSTIVPSEPLATVAFGSKSTNHVVTKEFQLENKGRRPHVINWVNEKQKKNRKAIGAEQEEPIFFKVFPETATLDPGASQTFVLKGFSPFPQKLTEKLLCNATVDKMTSLVFESEVTCSFDNPLLEFPKKLSFAWCHHPDQQPTVMSQTMTVKNVSSFNLDFTIKSTHPFKIDQSDYSLKSGDSITIPVHFDPTGNSDKQAGKIERQLAILYKDHPQRDIVDLVGELTFPNLAFDAQKVDFGCILNYNEKRIFVNMANKGPLVVNYSWSFVSREDDENVAVINRVFDILPIRGTLHSGQSESVEFIFRAGVDKRYTVDAVCSVEGGPDYRLRLTGESAAIQYKLDTKILNFDFVPYNTSLTREFSLLNTGKVGFKYSVNTRTCAKWIKVTPSSGSIAANGHQKFQVVMKPGVPERIEGKFLVEVQHFQGEEILFAGDGVFHHITCSLPRTNDEKYQRLAGVAKQKFDGKVDFKSGLPGRIAQSGPSSVSAQSEATITIARELNQQFLLLEEETERLMIKEHVESDAESKPLFLSDYLCDFGDVVKGTSRRRGFKIHNTGYLPVSFDIPKNILKDTGFTFDQDKVKKLVGFPSHDSVTFKVECVADERIGLGPLELVVPITIKDGPSYRIILRANIVTPDVGVSSDRLDFGKVLVGQCKMMTVQLHNVVEVPCEWSCGSQVLKSAKDATAFSIEPTSGTLKSGERVNIDIKFTPTEERKWNFTIPVKISKNPHPYNISCKGEGANYDVSFTPNPVKIGPILPYCREEAALVTMTNDTEFPTEIYSIDYDKQWISEEDILRTTPGYDRDVLLLPPRQPGQSLAVLLQTLKGTTQKKEEEPPQPVVSVMETPPGPSSLVPEVSPSTMTTTKKEATRPVSPATTSTEVAPPAKPVKEPTAGGPHKFVVFYGPSLSGKSTQAKQLSEKKSIPIWTLDDMIQSALKEDEAIISKAKKALNTEDDPSTVKVLPESLVVDILGTKLKSAEGGVIIDGLQCCYATSIEQAASWLLQAVSGTHIVPSLAVLNADKEVIRTRKANLFYSEETQITNQLKNMQSISEEEYDRMPPHEQTLYETTKRQLKARKKELMAKKRKELLEFAKIKLKELGEEQKRSKKKRAKPRATTLSGPTTSNASPPPAASKEANDPQTTRRRKTADKNAQDNPRAGTAPAPVPSEDTDDAAELDESVIPSEEEFLAQCADRIMSSYQQTLPAIVALFEKHPENEKEKIRGKKPKPVVKKGKKQDPSQDAQNKDLKEASDGKEPDLEVFDSVKPIIHLDASQTIAQVSQDCVTALYGPVEPEATAQVPQVQKVQEESPKEEASVPEIPPPRVFQIINKPTQKKSKKQQEELRFTILTPSSAVTSPPPEQSANAEEPAPVEPVPPASEESQLIQVDPKPALKRAGTNADLSSSQAQSLQKIALKKKQAAPPARKASIEGADVATAAKVSDPSKHSNAACVGSTGILKSDCTSDVRWIIPPKSSKTILICFSGDKPKIEQKLQFGVVGSTKVITLQCIGFCSFPQINQEPKHIFYDKILAPPATVKKERESVTQSGVRKDSQSKDASKEAKDQTRAQTANPAAVIAPVVAHKYNPQSKTFEFGPLLVGKTKEGYMDYKYAENSEKFRITNNGALDLDIDFCFQKDVTGNVFLLHPASMHLKKGESQDLSVWAYPKVLGTCEDCVIGLVKDNPEPLLIPISCVGAKPTLEVDKVSLDFGKLLLKTKDSQVLTLSNKSPLDLSWKITGVESLVDCTIAPLSGIIEPYGTCKVIATFEANQAATHKKSVKMEVYDTSNLLGVLQNIPISVLAEAYSVAVDVNFPKGSVGSTLNFGTVRVFEETRHTLSLKNKGKYSMNYKMVFTPQINAKYITINPLEGALNPSDKPLNISVVFKSDQEIDLKNSPEIYCQLTEPHNGQIIAKIPVNVTVRSIFSRYSILPERGINFGPFVYGTKKSRQFTIQNDGEFEFKFTLSRYNDASRELELGTTDAPQKAPTIKKTVGAGKKVEQSLALGDFLITPATGTVPAGGTVKVNVEFNAESGTIAQEIMCIDIADRNPTDHPGGIPYEFLAESCIPGINTNDYISIFEEQTVLNRLDMQKVKANCVYAIHERVFMFNSVILGQQAEERVKIINISKVPCTVNFAIQNRPGTSKDELNVFDVKPKKISIPPQDSAYVSVTFNPTTIKSYSAVFEGAVQGGTDNKTNKLTFELRGEATLPQVIVQQPQTKTKAGSPLLKFKRLLLGKSQTIPVMLYNDGLIPAAVKFDALSMSKAFTFTGPLDKAITIESKQSYGFQVTFHPTEAKQYQQEFRMKIQNNHFENTTITATGEGFMSEVTVENLPDDTEDELMFGECAVGVSKTLSFSLVNQGTSTVRFDWKAHPDFTLVPSVGHIQPRATKDVKITFRTNEPKQHKSVPLTCKIQKIRYQATNVLDWDDSMKSYGSSEEEDTSRKANDKLPEPAFKVAEDLKPFELRANVIADWAKYECKVSEVRYKNTLMYQTRSFSLPVKNLSNSSIQISWAIDLLEAVLDEDDEKPPFVITPNSASIPAGETTLFNVLFAPLEAGDFRARLLAKIPNLHVSCGSMKFNILQPSQKGLDIPVFAVSSRPLCHFELEESDYITSSRRSPELRGPDGKLGPLDPKTRVVEFRSCGIKARNTKKFYIVNPTNTSYDFTWECEEMSKNQLQVFHCLTKKGTVLSGKKFEIVFEFVPAELGLKESFWTFKIPAHNVNLLFLLVGNAEEPDVFFDHTHLNFNSILVSKKAIDVVNLVNNEDLPFSFQLEKSSLANEQKVLEFNPSKGTIEPRSQIPIQITFIPNAEKKYNLNVLYNVHRKPSALTLNVKGEAYAIHDTVEVEEDGGRTVQLSPNNANTLDLGLVQVNDTKSKKIIFTNDGKFPFDYSWKIVTPQTHQKTPFLFIQPSLGTIPKGEKAEISFMFKPKKIFKLEDFKIVCKITNGNKYVINVAAQVYKPALEFSFLNFDFGPCFLLRPGMPPVEKKLHITNKDTNEVTLDCLYKSKPHLEVHASPTVLAPGEGVDVAIHFLPKAEMQYSETVPFDINGLQVMNVQITGEGIRTRVELVNEQQQNINFGAVKIGQKVVQEVGLVNRSKRIANVSLAKSIKKLASHDIKYTPDGTFQIKPKETVPIKLVFEPSKRIPPFAEELAVDIEGLVQPLLFLSGSGQGIEFKLDSEILTFGSVVINGSSVQRPKLKNIGDIGTKFKWDESKFAPDFSISPSEGFLAPGMDVALKISFHPVAIQADIRYQKIPCYIEGSTPLYVTLVGSCVAQSENETMNFKSPVRKKQTKTITLTNTTVNPWRIKPIFENDYWSSPTKSVKLAVGQSIQFDIEYLPLSMTADKNEHKGTVFFALPDGGGILYQLVGQALPPLPVSHIAKQIPCKTNFSQLLPVKNWLQQPQRFKVSIDSEQKDVSTVLKGLDYIDVPALGERQYKLNFYSFKEGNTNFKVTFTNEETKEYLYYTCAFTTIAPNILDVVELETPVRRPITHVISVENPLEIPAAFTVTCDAEDVSVSPSFTIPPGSDGKVEVTFFPFVIKENVAHLILNSPQLGLYPYDLKLKSTPAGNEKPLYFKVGLGSKQVQTFRFINYSKTKTEYHVFVDSEDFMVDKSFTAPAAPSGAEVTVDVIYEPSKLGDVRATLKVVSDQGGEYLCSLFGHCIAPQPQGPILVKGTMPVSVSIFNPFTKTATFTLNVDNPAFAVKPTEVAIGSKKSSQVSISFKGSSGVTTAKLTVSSEEVSTPWIFYLKGTN